MDVLRLMFYVPKHLSKHPHAFLDQIVKERSLWAFGLKPVALRGMRILMICNPEST